VVTDTGKAPRTGAIKPLNAPAAIQVRVDGETGAPVAVRLPVLAASARSGGRSRGRQARPGGQVRPDRTDAPLSPWQAVTIVDDRWKVVDEWWRGENQQITRMYYSLVLENGQRTTAFHDFSGGAWYRQAS